MPKFNKVLSQLESMYQISKPVVRDENPILISDFIHHIFENSQEYGIEHLSSDWMDGIKLKDEKMAVNFVNGLLEQNGHLISRKSILEGIKHFSKEIENEQT